MKAAILTVVAIIGCALAGWAFKHMSPRELEVIRGKIAVQLGKSA